MKLPGTILALAGLVCAGPALATGSGSCRGTINPGLRLELVIGRGAGPVIAQVRIRDGDRTLTTGEEGGPSLAQSWLDEKALHIDVTDANGGDHLAQLRTWRPGGRGAYSGSLRYRGRSYQMRCSVD